MQIDERKNTIVFSPVADSNQAYRAEFMKGEVSGMYTVINMLELLIEAMEQEAGERNLENNDEDA